MIAFIIVLVLFSLSICILLFNSYEKKVDSVYHTLSSYFSKYAKLQSLIFEVKTNGKNIRSWNSQHRIDYIINNNYKDILNSIELLEEYIPWWEKNIDVIRSIINSDIHFKANDMTIMRNRFIRRCNEGAEQLYQKYNPTNIKFELRTFSSYQSSYYDFQTRSYTNKKISSRNFLSHDIIISRISVLQKYNFEMTEYQYNCENQRKLMTRDLREKIIERDDGVCQICRKKCSSFELEIDHILPISKGGKTTPSNLQVLCAACNRKKSDKILEDWEYPTNNVIRNPLPFIYSNSQKKVATSFQSKTFFSKIDPKNCAQIGDLITIEDMGTHGIRTLLLQNSNNSSFTQGVISTSSPLGRAIVAQSINDIVYVDTPSGCKKIIIRDIEKA